MFRNPVPWPEQPEDRAQRTRLATRLAPHWVRATHLYLQIDLVDVLRRAYAEAANMVPYAMVVFDNGGDVFLVNAKAQRLITGDGLILRRHGLHALEDTENQALQDAISAVIEANLHHRPHKHSKDVVVSRPSGRRAYQVIVKPLSPGRFGDGRRPAAAAVIVDPDEEFIVTLERCQEIFGFTRAEAQVALGIMQGRSLEQIAETHGNTVITARNLLKRAFNKAGVKRQNELTRLLLNSPSSSTSTATRQVCDRARVRRSGLRPDMNRSAAGRTYDRPRTSCIEWRAGARPGSQAAARTAPRAKAMRLDALWVISMRSPSAANSTV